MGLFNQVVTSGSRNDFAVLGFIQNTKGSFRGGIAAQLIGVNHFWNVVFREESFEKACRGFGVTTGLEVDIQHRARFIDGPPQPVGDSTDVDLHFIEVPSRTPTGFSMV